MNKRALIAIGGNSLVESGQVAEIPLQWDTVRATCGRLVDLIVEGWQILVTHGNGPQVGFNLLRSDLAAEVIYPLPLDLLVAHTQGSIGYMLQQGLANELRSRGRSAPVVTIITQVLVDEDDPAFQERSKPIGLFMSKEEADKKTAEGWHVMEDAGRGWRRVVASPRPQKIIEEEAIDRLMRSGCVVIAGGGGGIPVVSNDEGELRELHGVWGVVDKDRSSSLLARRLGFDRFVISTGVSQVYINFKTSEQKALTRITVAEARHYLEAGEFGRGSMAPKIEAAAEFTAESGNPSIITDPENIGRALRGETGTWIVAG